MIKPLQRNNSHNKPKFRLNFVQKLLLIFGVIILAFSSLPIMVVLLIGLLPTLTIILTDPRNSNKLTIVGCLNFSGVFICLVRIFNQYAAGIPVSIMGNIFNIVIMLGFAALGVIFYYELPNLFIVISKASAQRRLHSIDNKLEKLTQEWGSDVISDLVK
ncbi:MAG: hypothetical protein KHX55_00380 [Proteobacteria bacterium]|nr:hypothetical protein [Pseudomonadota bacterium]